MTVKMFVVVLIMEFLAILNISICAGDCSFEVKILSSKAPLLLNNVSLEFIYPENSGKIKFRKNEIFKLVCTGVGNSLKDVSVQPSNVVAKCVKDEEFQALGDNYYIKNLAECTQNNKIDTQDPTPSMNVRSIYIGFQLVWDKFIPLIETVYDKTRLSTYYTKYHLNPALTYKQIGKCDVSFSNLYIDGVNIRRQYEKKNEHTTLELILGDKGTVDKYFNDNEYLAKGHLSACADFVYASQQRATFFYINTAPQWQKFNNGDWKSLESNLRNLAATFASGLHVFSGTSGVATLPDKNNIQQELYIYVNGAEKKVPVPKYFWKVVIDPLTNKGRAFLGLNIPENQPVPNQWYSGICDPDNVPSKWIGVKVVTCPVSKFNINEFAPMKKGVTGSIDLSENKKRPKGT